MDKKVLLVADDDEMCRKIIKTFLSDTYEIIEAVDGGETLDKIKENKIDALLLDIIMPGIDGLEVLKTIRSQEDYDHIGILVATSTKEKTEREALAHGADDIVSKPYDPVVIKRRLGNILTVKDVVIQKTLLETNNIAELVQKEKSLLNEKVSLSLEKINNKVNVIQRNKTNIELVDEMINSIYLETSHIKEMF